MHVAASRDSASNFMYLWFTNLPLTVEGQFAAVPSSQGSGDAAEAWEGSYPALLTDGVQTAVADDFDTGVARVVSVTTQTYAS